MMRVLAPTCPDCGAVCILTKPLGPNPTDEQIFGRKCDRCGGTGRYHFEYNMMADCPDCSGTGRIGAAENRWMCLGGNYSPRHDDYCLGHDNIFADPALWEEVKCAWRTRTKTTEWRGNIYDGGGLEEVSPIDTATRGKWTITVTFEPEEVEG